MIVAVTGAGGFVGRAVVRELQRAGSRVVALGRAPASNSALGVETRRFDPNGAPDPQAFAGCDAVVHLAGETVAGRWTPEKKRRVAESRIAGTKTVVASLAALAQRPAVLVSASAVGYYGDRGDEPLTEASAAGSGFLAGVCAGWEAAAQESEAFGVRHVCLRTAIALGSGGALDQMRVPFSFFAGGPLGTGRQFVPWIHVGDLAALYRFAIENASIRGAVNAVAPDYATNARLLQAIGAALGRPSLLPAPPLALRAVLGEFAQSLLSSALVLPTVGQDAGFEWKHPQLERALCEILRGTPVAKQVHHFEAKQFVPRPLDEVFGFFSDARNLGTITPPALGFAMHRAPHAVSRGSEIEYHLRIHGVPVRWKTLICEFEPQRRFVDVQVRGPYALWRHVHDFTPRDGGVEIGDAIDYVLPLAPFGELAAGMVHNDVREIFAFRRAAIERLFAPA
ncbi:MAG TPA: TIGR01777 family oxidoreductase [Candidatus Cybelea sp.]|nr:TIGR01777 family oxidoreductase [Candidatus Cybelea sp.]